MKEYVVSCSDTVRIRAKDKCGITIRVSLWQTIEWNLYSSCSVADNKVAMHFDYRCPEAAGTIIVGVSCKHGVHVCAI